MDRALTKRIIDSWLDQFDDFIPIDREPRINAFFFLFENLIEIGKLTMEEISVDPMRKKIIEASVHPSAKGSQKSKWTESVTKDFDKACRLKNPIELKMHSEESVTIKPLELNIVKINAIGIPDIGPEEQVVVRRGKPITPEMLEKFPKVEHEMDADFIKEMGIVVNLNE